MSNRFLLILVTLFLLFTGNLSSQDQSKLMEISSKIQKLMMQMQDAKNDEERNRIQSELDLLMETYFEEAERVEKEILSKIQEFEKSLPPTLKKIHNIDKEISELESDLPTSSEKINAASKEILQLMGKLYKGDNEIPADMSSFIVSLKFSKEITIDYRLKGKGHVSDDFYIEYDIGMQLKSYWSCDYHVDVIKRKGYLNSHSIYSVRNETYPEKLDKIKFSGCCDVVTHRQFDD